MRILNDFFCWVENFAWWVHVRAEERRNGQIELQGSKQFTPQKYKKIVVHWIQYFWPSNGVWKDYQGFQRCTQKLYKVAPFFFKEPERDQSIETLHEGPVKLIKQVKIAHSFLQSVSDQFHIIILSLPK